jgi:hypothetical protein
VSTSAWAGGSALPLTSWRDGHLVYTSATATGMTADQALEAGERLIEHARALKALADPDAQKAASLAQWKAEHTTGQCPTCNEWEQRRAGRTCLDCQGGTGPCACQLEERPHLRLEAPVTISKENL